MQPALTASQQAHDPAFLREVCLGTPAMFRVTLGLAFVGYAALAFVDPLLASGVELEWALLSRAVYGAITVAFFALTFVGDWAVRHGRWASITHALLSGHEVVFLTWLVGGGDSAYHEALHIVMFGYALLAFPWKRWDAAFVFGSYVVHYNVLLIVTDRTGPTERFVSANALLVVTWLVAIVFQRVLTNARHRDFVSRRALADANERLKALDDAKSRFFANLSHELRTPLTLIVAPIEATLDSVREPLGEAQAERMRLARRNALRLLRLVDDLLALTKAESAALSPKRIAVHVAPLMERLHRDVEALAARKNIAVSLDIEPGIPPLDADPALVDRVLLNLIGNAAKFVGLGGRIGLSAHRDLDHVVLSVSDDGPGIPPEALPRVFDRFFQADSGSTRRTGGTGIGLSLVREIVEAHGGRVRAESSVGSGTTIRCWFPAASVDGGADTVSALDAPELPVSARVGLPEWHDAIRTASSYRYLGIDDATDRRVAPRPRPRGDAPKVLVVEDNPDMIRFIVALMAVEYNVFAARNGVEALRILSERQPDIIISDVMMPEMDGFEFVRRVRENPDTRSIPFVFLTARGGVEDRVLGHAGGADTYLAKPFRSEELLAAVEALLARQATVRASSSGREEEALIFMASGVAEVLRAAGQRISELEAAVAAGAEPAAELAAARSELERLEVALTHLATSGVGSVPEHAEIAPVVEAVAASGASVVSPAVPVKVHIEHRQLARAVFSTHELEEILRPILARAVAVTPPGASVTVRVSGGEHQAFIAIRDDGAPMTAQMVERLFFPFGDVGTDPIEGLALVAARRLLRARGGNVVVEPQLGMGTEIRVFVPLMRIAAEAA